MLKWFEYDLSQKTKPSVLLEHLKATDATALGKLHTENEILAMSYFHYLEERGFLGQQHEYLYGRLLNTVNQELEEPTLVFLELLKIFFPAGLEIQPIIPNPESQLTDLL